MHGDGTGTVDLSNFGGASSGGVTLDVTGSGVQWANTLVGNALGGAVTNSGVMTIATANGNLSLVGVLTNSSTGTINVTGTESVLANAGGAAIDNDGTFDFQTAAIVDNFNDAGTFNNYAGGILECTASSGAAMSNFLVNDLGTIEGNSGTLELTGGGSGGPIASPGTVNAGSTPRSSSAGTSRECLQATARAPSTCRILAEHPPAASRSTSPAAECNGRTPRLETLWAGPSQIPAR